MREPPFWLSRHHLSPEVHSQAGGSLKPCVSLVSVHTLLSREQEKTLNRPSTECVRLDHPSRIFLCVFFRIDFTYVGGQSCATSARILAPSKRGWHPPAYGGVYYARAARAYNFCTLTIDLTIQVRFLESSYQLWPIDGWV